MTVKRSYICNMCRKEIESESDGVALRWTNGVWEAQFCLIDSENHICKSCLGSLRRLRLHDE